jgi:hypothetical protein
MTVSKDKAPENYPSSHESSQSEMAILWEIFENNHQCNSKYYFIFLSFGDDHLCSSFGGWGNQTRCHHYPFICLFLSHINNLLKMAI